MIRPPRLLALSALWLSLHLGALSASAQEAPPASSSDSVADQATITEDYQALQSPDATRQPRRQAAASTAPASGNDPAATDAGQPPSLDQSWRSFQPPRRVTRTSPNSYSYGYGASSGNENNWGYRNGHVGRLNEYYPPDDQFQNGGAHNYVAQFDQGPYATKRQAQFQAESLGIAKYNSIQGHIDRYGMPRIGYGFGFGFGGFVP